MTGLRLKLAPNEQVLINGAVVQNGRSKVELRIKTPNTKILRLRDAIHPHDVDTPTKRICYVAQLAVAGEVAEGDALAEFQDGVQALQKVFTNPSSAKLMDDALVLAADGNFYMALQKIRQLLPYEEWLMGKAVPGPVFASIPA